MSPWRYNGSVMPAKRLPGSEGIIAPTAITALLVAFIGVNPAAADKAANDADNFVYSTTKRPKVAGFNTRNTTPLLRHSNATLAKFIIDVAFKLEKGAHRQGLAKWQLPVHVHLDKRYIDQAPLDAIPSELDAFLAELHSRTNVKIERTKDPSKAQVFIRIAPTIEMRRTLGTSFCLATPADVSWPKYLQQRQTPRLDWSQITQPTKATIFIPDNAKGFLVRTCLFEELMQVLGPAGDFYYLAGSIFNDDQIHLRPTAFDYLVLKTIYDPRLKPGLPADQAERIAHTILDDLNPAGRKRASLPTMKLNENWSRAFQLAELMHHPKFADNYYDDAITQTQSMPQHDPRRLLTRLNAARNLKRYWPIEARKRLVAVARDYKTMLGPQSLYEAVTHLDIATIDLWQKNFERARKTTVNQLPVLIGYGREDKIAEALLIRDAADDQRQRTGLAVDAKPDTRAWNDYLQLQRQRVKQIAKSKPTHNAWLWIPILLTLCVGVLAYRYRRRRYG